MILASFHRGLREVSQRDHRAVARFPLPTARPGEKKTAETTGCEMEKWKFMGIYGLKWERSGDY